jgi:hypothetical protein
VLTDGEYVEIDDVSITVCPWWDGPHGRAEVGRQLARDAGRRRRRWIWVYHAPPDDSPTSWTITSVSPLSLASPPPLCPAGPGNSPYAGSSANAGNPLLVSIM